MTKVETNFQRLKASRKMPRPGDVFAMKLPDDYFLFGRVVSIEAKWTLATGADDAILVYIYRDRFERSELPRRDAMRVDRLLIAPILTNLRPWSSGYFQTVSNVPLTIDDTLSRHCFLSTFRGRFFDEHGNEMFGPAEPVGDFALQSFRTIDDQISDALGIPRVAAD